MRYIVSVFLSIVALLLAAPGHVKADGLCREGCVLWCNDHRPQSSCYDACVGRPTCLTGNARNMRGQVCRAWCDSHKQGNYGCLGDCIARDKKYGLASAQGRSRAPTAKRSANPRCPYGYAACLKYLTEKKGVAPRDAAGACSQYCQ